jgi:uncharacterized protein with HEPN domain
VTRAEHDRLRDIKEATAAIRDHLERAGIDADQNADSEDALLHDALLYQFVIIGEAVKHLAPETRDSTSEIPWTQIAGLRDVITHAYFRIDIGRVLEIVEHDLPPLEEAIDRLLAPDQPESSSDAAK